MTEQKRPETRRGIDVHGEVYFMSPETPTEDDIRLTASDEHLRDFANRQVKRLSDSAGASDPEDTDNYDEGGS